MRPTSTTRISPNLGSSSGMNPEEDFSQGLGGQLELDFDIPRGQTPSSGLLPGKGVPRSPLGLEIGQSAGGGLNITGALPLGGPISGRGGVNIGKDGAIKGGQIGLGIGLGPLGASIDAGTDADETGRGGCYQYVTVSIGPFSHTYGRNVCEPGPKSPASSPSAPSGSGAINLGGFSPKFSCPGGGEWEIKQAVVNHQPPAPPRTELWAGEKWLEIARCSFHETIFNPWGYSKWWEDTPSDNILERYEGIKSGDGGLEKKNADWANYMLGKNNWYKAEIIENTSSQMAGGSWYWGNSFASQQIYHNVVKFKCTYKVQVYRSKSSTASTSGAPSINDTKLIVISINPPPKCPTGEPPTRDNPSVSNPLPSPPLPNPPPRKKMEDKCCKALAILLLMEHKHLGVSPEVTTTPLQDIGVVEKGQAFYGEPMAFPFDVPKNWLDPLAGKQDKIGITNLSQLLFIMGSQAERLERVLGTKEFIKDSEGKLRQSEGNALSWLSGKNPDFAYPDPNDFWKNTEDGIINEKKLEVRNLTDAIRYVVEMGNRLERILPIAELKNSSIPKRWIYPGAKGQERVGNLIHLIELMVRSDDKHRGYWPIKVKVKDADPAIKDDQPVELEFHSQADVFRELFQFLIDMEGDGDMSSNFLLRIAFQLCQMHQLTVQNNAMLDATVEYLDFKVKNIVADIPMPFDPFAGKSPSLIDQALEGLGFIDGMPLNPSIDSNKESDIEALAPSVLQNTIVKVDIIECDESKTLNEALLELLKHASASSAAVSERISDSAIDRVIDGAGLAQKLNSFLRRRDVANALVGIGDLDKWINSAESGYTDKPEAESLRFPESDPLQPYNRPIAENPKIREIDTKDPKAD